MTSATAIPNLAEVLAAVAKWKADEEARQAAELVEVDQEVENLRSAMVNLQQQLEALAKFREDLVEKQAQLASEEARRNYEAVFETLLAQLKAVLQRTEQVSVAHKARAAAIEEKMTSSEVAPLVEEYEQFKTAVEPTLESLPESYRTVMMAHHESLAKQVQEHRDAAMAIPLDLEVDDMTVEIVFAVDAPEGSPELLIAVIPVSAETDTGEDADESLQTWLSGRVVEAIYETVNNYGPSGAEVVSGGHQGMLAVEVDLLGAPHDFGDKLLLALDSVSKAATELQTSGVSLVGRQVAADFILPPEGDEEDE